MYRPNEAAQMTTPFTLLVPSYETSFGVKQKTFVNAGNFLANCKTFGGTESNVNGVLAIEDTAQLVCWFRPDIRSDCRVERLTDNAVFDILGEPENIEMRNMFLKFKISRVKGGA